MSDFDDFFSGLEEKLNSRSRLAVIQKANQENNRQYKVNRLLFYWLKLKRFFCCV